MDLGLGRSNLISRCRTQLISSWPWFEPGIGLAGLRGPASPSPSGVFLIPQAVEALSFIVLY